MMLKRLSVRARITLGSVLVAALIFAIALIVVRVQASSVLEQADESLARNDLTSFVADISSNPDESVDDPGTGVLVYVRSPSGTVQVDTLPRSLHGIVEHREAADEKFDVEEDDSHFVVVGRTVETPEGTWSLWAARSSESSVLALRSLNALLAIGGAILLAAFGVASWFLVSAALRPVERLRRSAEQLASTAERYSLPVSGANDEIAQLATTLNAFLDGVRDSADREKRMVSDAAHELRTPLAALKTQLEIAREDSADPRLSAQLAAAETSVDRLTNLATNLLELARLEQQGTIEQSATADEIGTEFLSSIDRARLLALERDVVVDYSLGSIDSKVGASAISFSRLVDNLLANAVNAATTTVVARLTQREGTLELSVSDDGPGMPEAFLASAFERFTRADTARTGGGSGLGLSLVRAIAEAAGGTVTLHNRAPGFEARVLLPNM